MSDSDPRDHEPIDPGVIDAMGDDFLTEVEVFVRTDDLDDQHCVLETDPLTGRKQVIGPFATSFEALQAAQTMTERAPAVYEEPPFPEYGIIPYFTRESAQL